MATAFEAITTRQSWYAGAAVDKYMAVEFGTDGKYQKADGTGLFAGFCEYPCEAADRMITVVKGTYPGIASAAIAAGAHITLDTTNAGKIKTAGSSDNVIGVALNAASAAGELVSVAMVEAPIPASGV